jgi:hypothetical protein
MRGNRDKGRGEERGKREGKERGKEEEEKRGKRGERRGGREGRGEKREEEKEGRKRKRREEERRGGNRGQGTILLSSIFRVVEVQSRGDEIREAVCITRVSRRQEDVGEVQQLSHQDGGHDGYMSLGSTDSLDKNLSKK